MRKRQTWWIALLTLALSIGVVTPSHAASGIVRVTIAKSGFVVSAGGGKGVLTFRHHDYPFTVQGISLGLTAGASLSEMVGWASHLNELSDFSGTYSVIGARNVRGIRFRNAKGVIITFVDPRGSLEVGNFTKVVVALDQSRSTAN
jgi:succinate dehydrogenase/fumarate reductase flavoprotein subunit